MLVSRQKLSLTMTEKIKILFLAASPIDSGRLRLDEELREIKKRILMGPERHHFELVSEWAVTPDDLQQALLAHQPHIVHFSGHGSRTQGIVLEDQFGNSQMMSKSALIELFKILKDNIRIIFLNACYSGRQVEGLSEVIDYTVGVKTAISDNAAIPFAASFYQGLAYGRLVKEAFDLANNRLKTEGFADAKRPELLVRKGPPDPDPWLVPPKPLIPSLVEPIPVPPPPDPITIPLPPDPITVPFPFLRREFILWITAGILLISGLYFTFQYLRESSRRQRYMEAVDQLKNQTTVTGRANAIENLGQLAADPDFNDYYERIINTLANFIRENAKPKKNGNVQPDGKISGDVQAALRILGWRRHKWGDEEEPQRLELSNLFLREADIKHGTEPQGAHMEGALFINTNLERAMLREVNLENAILRDANLRYAVLYKANLTNADLRGADLERADMQWVKGLTVGQIKVAKNWDKAIFTQEFEDELRATP